MSHSRTVFASTSSPQNNFCEVRRSASPLVGLQYRGRKAATTRVGIVDIIIFVDMKIIPAAISMILSWATYSHAFSSTSRKLVMGSGGATTRSRYNLLAALHSIATTNNNNNNEDN